MEWNTIAQTYNDSFWESFSPFAHIAEKIPDRARVLDVGCGTGNLSMILAPRVEHVIGIDISDQMLEKFEVPAEYAAKVEKICASCTELDAVLSSRRFSHVVSSITIMFVPDIRTALLQMSNALEPDGKIVIGVWSTLSKCPAAQTLEKVLGHVNPLNWRFGELKFLEETLREAGLEVISVEEFRVESKLSSGEILESWQKAAKMLGREVGDQVHYSLDKLNYYMTVNIVTARRKM